MRIYSRHKGYMLIYLKTGTGDLMLEKFGILLWFCNFPLTKVVFLNNREVQTLVM